ncbi:lytic transglycosylase F [Desulfatitalea alkaliphila]|uniref:Lytic transglycosylase F n=1 Tax=Desulfatitalea alkaliphila TaxID=2929485 RepID=A0AA41R2J3_9BACT|nr:lytic transglycosylase F [Desulfatitalea alkaliphila]MCJ8500904.1 lytic transglycosylase F [Desulfatitalea alkaliphila]
MPVSRRIKKGGLWACGAILFLLLLLWLSQRQFPTHPPAPATSSAMDRIAARWTGDLVETIEKRRFIRALVSYNQTNFFIDRGTPRGIEYELLKAYEAFLNRRHPSADGLKIKVVFTVLPFAELLPALREGRGDIAAAGLTVTDERRKQVAFTRPYFTEISEVLVTHDALPAIESLEDLYGRTLHVLDGSSYIPHLQLLNQSGKRRLRPTIHIVPVDPRLEEEDILQMVNAGIFEMTVADDHIARIWSEVLPDIRVWGDIAIHQGGEIAWAVRPDNPELLADLNAFLATHRQGSLAFNLLVARYYENTHWIRNPLSEPSRQRFAQLMRLFRQYADQYDFDWLKIAALAYQESGLDPNARSHRGAVGIMQVLPRTAAGPAIDIPDIHDLENNIHAGVKYLAYLRDTYFDDPDLALEHRTDFAIAAYNAGPARINRLRRRAAEQGLDPNRWFLNVEHVARQSIGSETVQYVSNVYIYYVAYRTAYELGKLG